MNPATTASGVWLRRGFAFAVPAFLWWRFSENTADNDLWGHVLYGQRMLHLGGLETTETLSWTAAGQPWINHEVLAELALGAAHRLGGGSGLWLLMIGLAALTLAWAWRAGAGSDPARRLVALALLAICANSIALGYAARPQLFTYLLFVVLLTALRRFLAGGVGWGLVPPLLLVVWANTHGGYLAGWAVLLVALGTEVTGRLCPGWLRRLRCEPTPVLPGVLTVAAIASTLALCANPWGWRLVLWTIDTLRLPRPAITEWQPMGFAAATLPFHFTIGLGLAAWVCSRRSRRLWEMLVWALLAAMAVRHQRHAPLFGLATVMLLPAHVHDLLARIAPATRHLQAAISRPAAGRILAVALTLGGAWCLAASVVPRRQPFTMAVPRDLYPVEAIRFMREQGLTGNTVTFFDWGQQVLWELPDNPVSFDGRLDTVYPAAVRDAHWRLYAGAAPGPALDLERARYALLPSASAGIDVLRRHGWSSVYADPLATVLQRGGATGPARPGGADAVSGSEPFPDSPPVLATRAPRTVHE
ncbi:MAG: hypothetical protein ACOZE5_16015 [Verrucomicrobiota bacterium]